MNLIIFGPPGAGKGTQAAFIAASHGAAHISTGDLLRRAVREKTPTGTAAKKFMDKGELVPDSVVTEIIADKIQTLDGAGFLLDGFPRTVAQARALDEMLAGRQVTLGAVLSLGVDEDETVRRLLIRAEAEGRNDDSERVIRNRLEVYRRQTLPLAEYYNSKGILREIDGNRSVEDVRRAIDCAISEIGSKK